MRKAVLTLYGISIGLGIVSIIMVNLQDGMIGIFLIILGIGTMVLTKKLGYFEYFALDKIYGWIKDMTDEAGLNRERRTFLSLQIEISGSKTPEEMWQNICRALEKLRFSRAEFYLGSAAERENGDGDGSTTQKEKEKMGNEGKILEPEATNSSMFSKREMSVPWIWPREQFHYGADPPADRLLKIDLPLVNDGDLSFGTLRLIKDLKEEPIDYYTLRRVESLRRAVVRAMDKIAKAEGLTRGNGGQSSPRRNQF